MRAFVEFKMPENCDECPIHDYEFNYCQLFDENEDVIEVPDTGIDMEEYKQSHHKNRPSWCPLKPSAESMEELQKKRKEIGKRKR